MSVSSVIRAAAVIAMVAGATAAAPGRADAPASRPGGENLLVNGDFEKGLEGWHPFWSRQKSAGRAEADAGAAHGGHGGARIEHAGKEDWSLQQSRSLTVRPGELYEFSAWMRVQGEGRGEISVILYDPAGKATAWQYAARGISGAGAPTKARAKPSAEFVHLVSRFYIPAGAARMSPRVVGVGPAVVHVDDMVLTPLSGQAKADVPAALTAQSDALHVRLETRDATLALTDRRTNQTYVQKPLGPAPMVLKASAGPGRIEALLVDPQTAREVRAVFRIDGEKPELVVELSSQGELSQPVQYPHPFATPKGTFLVMPVNEGISYPVDDASIRSARYILYGGHGLCMSWYGATDGRRGIMALVETGDDASVRMERRDGLLCLAPQWDPQKGRFGPTRRVRYVLLDDGGYVAMAKRYRRHAQQTGLLKTLAQKRKENPNVDLLVGAVNVWCWDKDPVGIVGRLQQAGIDRILWSNRASPDQLATLNRMGVLTSRYDIYQDVMDPAMFPRLRYRHGDWPSEAWPKDLMIDSRGQWIRGWRVEARDGEMIPCGVTCDRQAVAYAKARIGEELKTAPYRCRFIDTTTASPWRECYHPDHPVTRSESRHWKMELLRLVSEGHHLVAGSETGHDAAVPFVHYFEGMMSLGPYRCRDSGRRMQQILDEVPPQVATFQTGHAYRLPLWELVYHDCVVAQWYWGDYNNKIPAVWDRRDLFNALYGTPPMFMFNTALWDRNRERFVRSYRASAGVTRATGYSEMLDHRWLSDDHAVQQTRFADGTAVTVNFGDAPARLADGATLAPLGIRVEGPGAAKTVR